MIVSIDTDSPTPPYEQIRAQIAEQAAAGVLAEGFRLPTIRQLAGDLGLAPGTVARAYRELETAAVVVSRVRHGTVIAAPKMVAHRNVAGLVEQAARSYALAVRSLDVPLDQAVAALQAQLRALES